MRGTSADDDRIRAVIGWDIRNWSRALPIWQRQIDLHKPRRALAIGERGGGLSLWLATQGIHVVCTDLGTSLEPARELHERYGVSDLVTYDEQDATAIALPDQSFDLVIFKSVIGALRTKERQEQAISEMHRILRPNGLLLFAENLVGSWLHAQMRLRFVPWEQAWRYISLREIRELLAAFDALELKTWGVVGLLGRSERQRDLLGRIDSLVSPRVPPAWRYILFAACVKRDA